MRGYRRCRNCGDKSFNVEQRTGLSVWLCAECNVDVRTSSTVKLAVEDLREHNDRYTRLAERHGL